MKNLLLWEFTEKSDFQGGGVLQKTNIQGGIALKKGAMTVCRFKGEGGQAKKREGVFEGG